MAEAGKSIMLPRTTTSALSVDSMRERLMNHEFDGAAMIRRDRLAKEYNVSLSPVHRRNSRAPLRAQGAGP